jgi:hypothetical protein
MLPSKSLVTAKFTEALQPTRAVVMVMPNPR